MELLGQFAVCILVQGKGVFECLQRPFPCGVPMFRRRDAGAGDREQLNLGSLTQVHCLDCFWAEDHLVLSVNVL